MTQNKFTTNNNPTLVAVSNVDGESPVYLYADPTTHGLVISGSISVSADGAILDGASSSIRATVFDLTSSNPVATAIVDANGDQISSFGGGTQYTEGDTDASITGTAFMWEDTSDTLRPVSAAKPLPVDIKNTVVPISHAPTATSTNAPDNYASTAYENSEIIKPSAGVVYGLSGYSSRGTVQYIHFYDSTTLPADGTAPSTAPIRVPANSNFSIDFGVYGRYFATGIVISNSTTASTKTIGAADTWFDVQYK